VQILNIRNSTGTIDCELFASPDGFPREFLRSAIVVMVLRIQETQARCDFEDIPPGTYALAVVHDENMNGKLDTSLLFRRERSQAITWAGNPEKPASKTDEGLRLSPRKSFEAFRTVSRGGALPWSGRWESNPRVRRLRLFETSGLGRMLTPSVIGV